MIGIFLITVLFHTILFSQLILSVLYDDFYVLGFLYTHIQCILRSYRFNRTSLVDADVLGILATPYYSIISASLNYLEL